VMISIDQIADDFEAEIQRLSPLSRSEDAGNPSHFDGLAVQRLQALITGNHRGLTRLQLRHSAPKCFPG
ncbi:MAG: hypothetical protein WBM08_07725, partial [Prochlorococcaceae cyanobacterium]